MALYVEISRRVRGQADWESLGSAEVCGDGRTLRNLSIPEGSLAPGALEAVGLAISHDENPHPEEELADQMGTVTVAGAEYAYKTIFANPQVPGG